LNEPPRCIALGLDGAIPFCCSNSERAFKRSCLTRCSSYKSSLCSLCFSNNFFFCFSSIYLVSSIAIYYYYSSLFRSRMFFSSLPANILPCFSRAISRRPSTTRPHVIIVGKSIFVYMGEYVVKLGLTALCWFAGMCSISLVFEGAGSKLPPTVIGCWLL